MWKPLHGHVQPLPVHLAETQTQVETDLSAALVGVEAQRQPSLASLILQLSYQHRPEPPTPLARQERDIDHPNLHPRPGHRQPTDRTAVAHDHPEVHALDMVMVEALSGIQLGTHELVLLALVPRHQCHLVGTHVGVELEEQAPIPRLLGPQGEP